MKSFNQYEHFSQINSFHSNTKTVAECENVLRTGFVTDAHARAFLFLVWMGSHLLISLQHHAVPRAQWIYCNAKPHGAPLSYHRLAGLGGAELVGFGGAKRNTLTTEGRKSAKAEEQRGPEKWSRETLRYWAALKTHRGRVDGENLS